MKLSDYIVHFLETQGLEDVFMLSGGGCQHLIDSFGRSKKISYTCMHHEQALSMATEAYGRRTGKLGVAVVTSGPGATNAVTGLLGAWQDSSPCIFFSGQVKRVHTLYNNNIAGLRQFGQQEANIIPIVSSITKYAVMINDPQKIRYHLEKAMYLAKNGRPGPVWIDVPLDVQNSIIDETKLVGFIPDNSLKFEVNPLDVVNVIQKLKVSKRPVIVAGQGVRISCGCEEIRELVEKYKIPVVNSFLGIDILEGNHPCNIGRIGVSGTRAGNFTMQNADLLLVIGSRLSVSTIGFEPQMFAREAYKIVVDVDQIEHSKPVVTIDKFIKADAKNFLQLLLEKAKDCNFDFSSWLEKANNWKKMFPVILKEYDEDKDGINYYKLIDLINQNMTNDMTVVADAGSAFYVTCQTIDLKKGQRFVPSGALATMGYTLPASIGVSKATQNGKVIGVTGDGSFQQNIQELAVLKANHLPIKLFVVNNQGYLSIRRSQRKNFKENYVAEGPKSGVTFPDFKKVAEAYGIEYCIVKTVEEAKQVLPKVIHNNNAVLIEVISQEMQDMAPYSSTIRQPDGSLSSRPLEDMAPFIDRDLFYREMIVKPID